MFKSPTALRLIYPGLLWKKQTQEKIVYLTFDDGPVPGVTEYALSVLKEFGARAAFFCVGDNVRKYPGVFRKIISGGHRIGNHTFNHLNGWKTPGPEYLLNVQLCEEAIVNAGGRQPALFRPPHGRISLSQIRKLKPRYRIVMWDVLTKDYDHTIPVEVCLQKSIAATRPGSIVVFHDRIKNEERFKYMLPRYLQHFAELDYRFEALEP